MDETKFLTALSPLDGRYASKVADLSKYFSEFGLIRYRMHVEVEWLIFLADYPPIDNIQPLFPESKEKLRKLVRELTPEQAQAVKDFEKTTNHDVKAVEYAINQFLDDNGLSEYKTMVHFACTSEDINNLSYALMVRDAVNEVLKTNWTSIKAKLLDKAERYRSISMLSKTHGQPASPSTMGKEFFNVAMRMERQIQQLEKTSFLGKLNGAVGNFNAHTVSFPDIDWKTVSENFVQQLGLEYNAYTTQIEPHDFLAELFHNIMRWNTVLIDFSRDIWSYISVEVFKQIPVEGQTGSSTMPHKVNPIDFENAEGNLGLANALFDHLASKLPISRWQRDLTDSTVLRNIGVAFGYSILAYNSLCRGLDKLDINEKKLASELNAAQEVLGEAVQTVMRRYNIPNSYEKLKELTRGKSITEESLAEFIQGLEIPKDAKERLISLTPGDYVGLAREF